MASQHCIAVSPAHVASRLTRAQQSKRPKRLMEAVFSLAHSAASLLHEEPMDQSLLFTHETPEKKNRKNQATF
jgi:hypothetical protein